MVPAPDSTRSEKRVLERTLLFALVSLGMGSLADLLFFEKLPGISFPLYVVLTLGVVFLSAYLQGRKLPRTALYMVPLLLFFSGMVFVRASELLVFFNVVLSLYLLTLFVALIFKPRLDFYKFKEYLSVPFRVPLQALGKVKAGLAPLVARNSFMVKHQALPGVLRGVVIAVPVLILFVILFASADLIFRQYVTDIFSFEVNAELVWRTFWILAVAVGFFGLCELVARKPEAAEAGEAKESRGRNALTEVTVLFGSLNVLFFSFIIIQLAYLFGGAQNVVGGDFTYAEYARKGFFELIAVAGLSFLLIFGTERLLLREGQRHDMRFKLLSGALVVQVLIVLISAFKRLQLYENAYGYTSLRLYSHIFIVWLAVVFMALLYKIFADKRESVLALYMFASVMALFVVLNMINVDGMVARKNIARYNATQKLDLRYMSDLSDDANKELVSLLDSKDERVRQYVARELSARRQNLLDYDGAWQSTNVTRKSALKSLNKHLDQLKRSNDVIIDPGYRGPGH